MSNLSLPKMTWDTLRAKLASGTAFRTGVAKLAYETTAEWGEWGRSIIIRHHGNPIAEIGRDYFTRLYLLGRGVGQPTGTYLANIQHVPAHFSRVDELHHYVLHGGTR